MHRVLIFLLVLLVQAHYSLYAQEVTGELRKWHKVTILFNGPNTSENNSNNPFLHYRLNVTFTSPAGNSYIVPGFYAADGSASNSGANSGNKWAVRFTPNETGEWSYAVSFRAGTNVAISLDPNAGSPTSFNGQSGQFIISSSNKTLPDNRARGRLSYTGERYLKFQETGAFFLKAGADSPENLLAYNAIDNTVGSKTWSPHTQDWQTGDPTWQGGKGKGLIGAINYLSGKGMNSISFLTMNVKGDGKDVWPWVASSHDDLDGNTDAEKSNRTRYDVSKLEQWEMIFDHAESKGMYLHFKTQETENLHLLDGNQLGTQRKLYYRELVARFGHHLALNWNLGEEFDIYDPDLINSYASYFKDIDPYDNHIVIHSYPNTDQQDALFNPLLGENELTGASLQLLIDNIHQDVKKWVQASQNSGKKWVVANDEQGDAHSGVTTDASYSGNKGTQSDNRNDVRKKALWGTLMAGGAGVEYYFGYQTGETDLSAQDWRSRKSKWEDARIAIDFFQEYLPYWLMSSDDGITSATDDYCFSKTGEIYAIYLPNGGSTNLDLSSYNQTFSVRWFDPRIGGNFQNGSIQEIQGGGQVSIGNAPNSSTNDWVVLVQRTSETTGGSSNSGCEIPYEEENGRLVIESENLETGQGWEKNSAYAGYTGTGYIEWLGGNYFQEPGNGITSTKIKINTPGTYLFRWRSKVGHGTNSTESNDTWLRFPDASNFFGKKGEQIVYPHGSGKSPNPNGAGSDGWFKVFLSGTTNWTWSTATSDNDGHPIYVTFDEAGIYTMEISGRSNNHLIDRIVLAIDPSGSTDLNLTETVCSNNDQSPISVTDIAISPTEIILEVGEEFKLNAIISPENADNKQVTWSHSNASIAITDNNGIITAIGEGSTMITVISEDGNLTAQCTVEVISLTNNSDENGEDEISQTNCSTDFIEINNRVIIEAESLFYTGNWSQENDIAGFTGGGYIEWQGENNFQEPSSGITSATIEIQNPGTYRFQWHSKVGLGSDATESNDSWLRFPDADEFFGEKSNGGIVYPHGSGNTPTPNGSGANGWFKVYSSGTTDWTWSTLTSDNDGHNIYVTFTNPGTYTMEIAGRSKGHYIDRIVLSNVGYESTDLSLASTECFGNEESNTGKPSLIIENAEVYEGGELEFNVVLSHTLDNPVELELQVSGGTAHRSDYFKPNKKLTIPAGEINTLYRLKTKKDKHYENSETILLDVTSFPEDLINEVSSNAIGTILDDDAPMAIYPNPAISSGTVELTGMMNGTYDVTLFSLTGEMIKIQVVDIQGDYQYKLPAVNEGYYIIRADNSERSYSGKLAVN